MTVIKRGESYGVRIKRAGKQVWIGSYPTLREARRAEAEARLAPKADVTRLAASELAELFHEQHTAHKEASTRKNYRRATRAYVAAVADKRASGVTHVEAQAFANGHPRSTVDTISTMYEWAKRARILTENPFDGVQRRQTAKSAAPVILKTDEVDRLAGVALRALDPPMAEDLAAMILFAAGTAMRPAEIFALTWGAIDWQRDRVKVTHAVGADGQLKAPKNGKPREAPLLAQAREGLLLLEERGEKDLIFTSNRDGRLSKSTLAYRWHAVRDRAGYPQMRFYDLRHTCATRLLELGAYSYEVAFALGHQDGGRLVERTYGHPQAESALTRIAELDRVATEESNDVGGVADRVATEAKTA